MTANYMIRDTVGTVVLGLSTSLHCMDRHTVTDLVLGLSTWHCMDRYTVGTVVLGLSTSLHCMGRYTVSIVVLGLSTSLHCIQRCTGSGKSKEAVIKSRLNCKCDRELYDSLHCRQRRIRVEASFHCMDRDTVKGVVLGLRFRGTLWIVTL